MDSIISPSDSEEWPSLYIRGSKNLVKEITKINNITDGMIKYIGEWHSHPKGFNSEPSQLDYEAFKWLTERMNEYGLPALMIIVGDNCNFYVGKIKES